MNRRWQAAFLFALLLVGVGLGTWHIEARAGATENDADGLPQPSNLSSAPLKTDTWDWEQTLVDPYLAGAISLALDSANTPHISYHARDEYGYISPVWKYAVKEGDSWVTETIRLSTHWQTVYSSSLVLDEDGLPHIVFGDISPEQPYPMIITHAFKQAEAWQFEEVEVIEGACTATPTFTLLSDSSGGLHLFYLVPMPHDDGCHSVLKYARREGANSWQVSTLIEKIWSQPSIIVDREDNFHIAYTLCDATCSLHYSEFGSVDEFSPTIIFEEEEGQYIEAPSIALDSLNTPHIVFGGDAANYSESLYVAHQETTGWNIEGPIRSLGILRDTNSFFDMQGNLHVFVVDFHWGGIYGSSTVAEHYYKTQDGWQLEELTRAGSTSFALDSYGNIHGATGSYSLTYFYKSINLPTYSISGQVTTQDGTPLPDVSISTATGQATTDADGNYTINGVPAGTYDVSPMLAGYIFSPATRSVTVPADTSDVDFVATMTGACATASFNVQPVMFVNGWEGSVGNHSLADDGQLGFFRAHLAPHGYVEGCNLFYSTTMSPYKWLAENAVTIRNNMCLARLEVRKWNPSWNGHFSIIGYSYGGLRARAYLENTQLYETPCLGGEGSGSSRFIYVDRLFTLGTPHTGEIGDLPFATFIGIKALWGQEWPALGEMLPPVRVWQNLQQRQSSETRYIFIGGDARWQVATSISPLWPVYMKWKPAQILGNDFAVHQLSAFGLGMPSNLYPDVQTVETGDLHSQVPPLLDPLGVLESYVNPSATFNQHICGRLGLSNCPSSALGESVQVSRPDESVLAVVARQQTPTTSAAMPMMEVAAGELAAGETVEGEFELTGSGAWQTMLNWPAGRLGLVLTDPNGRTIDANVAEGDPVIDYLDLNTGFGFMASYTFSQTLPGSWSYQLTSLDDAAFYRLAVVPSLPIVVTASVPDWTPAVEAVPILASVTYDETLPLPGGVVVAEIDRADGSKDTLTLYDDSAHGDGAAGDGTFGASYLPPSGGYYGLLLTASGDYNGEPYQRNANRIFTVAPASAELSGQFSDRGFDEDGDSAFDFLEIFATVKVNQAGTYGLTAELFKGSTFISAAYTEVDLAADDFLQEIAIGFPAIDIVAAQLDGPYTVRNVMLTDESNGTVLIAADDNVHTTAFYRWSQFGQTPTATPTATPSPTPTGTPPTPTPTPTPTATPRPSDFSLLLPLISGAP